MTLDDAYDNSGHIPDAAAFLDRWADDAADWRGVEAAIGRARLNLPYGGAPRERFDLFLPAGRPEGLAVFVHGGYWLRFGREDWSHLAQGCTAAGWACALPSYTLAPEARITTMTKQIGQAIAAAAEQVRGPIALSGHSAGGHLVARMAMTDAPISEDVAARVVRVVPISPLSDLRPMLETTMNSKLGLDASEAASESPALGDLRDGVSVTTWVGGAERPAFLDQARWLGEAWQTPVRIAQGKHHFDVIDALREPGSAMLRDLLGDSPAA
ncbi:alpha/beta hydrolase [Rhodobacteraceae bacterium SC52]|nr:alpha/beta hydrolase [Rhodobacteraceae bacterium SC52]